MNRYTSNDKKKGLLAQKEKILQEIKYYEKRINEFPNPSSNVYSGFCSSDSEDDFPTSLDIGPSISELKQHDRLLRTCLQATQELTSVGVLQSEVNVLVEDPPLDGEKPVSEPGSWREVTAECRIDLVPFSITFYTHQPSRKFAACSYRGLRVLAVKTANEAELSKSVLSSLTQPSDAIEVLRSYALAYRSRRTTLARLADRYAADLNMEPLPEGGFVLKCANLLKMSWRLHNQVSPIAPFHHKMNFELEYMDESYLKIVKQAHRQLSDPSLQTDERTLLLAKIISTCLEAQTPTQELYESMESDPESIKKLEKTTLDDSDDEAIDRDDESESHRKKRDEKTAQENIDDGLYRDSETRKRKRDEEVMAPPKTIPKKTKPKGKENIDENRKAVKRNSQVDENNTKKARTVTQSDKDTENANSVTDIVKRTEVEAKNDVNKAKKAVNQKNTVKVVARDEKDKQTKSTEKVVNPKNSDIETIKVKKKVGDNVTSVKNVAKTTKEPKDSQDNAKNNDVVKKVIKKVVPNTNPVESNENNNLEKNKNIEKKNTTKVVDPNQNANIAKKKTSKIVKEAKNTENDNVEKVNENKVKNYEKTTASSQAKTKTDKLLTSKNSQVNPNSQNLKTNEDSTKTGKTKPNVNAVNKVSNNVKKNDDSKPFNDKKHADSDANKKRNDTDNMNAKKIVNLDPKSTIPESTSVNAKSTNEKTDALKTTKVTKSKETDDTKHPKNVTKINKNEINVATKDIKNTATKKDSVAVKPLAKTINPKNQKNPKQEKLVLKNHRGSGKVTKNISVHMNSNNSDGKISKIPQKKLSPAYAAVLQQNPIRVSPRMMSKFKSPSDSNIQKMVKPVTNIPRLLKKPSSLI